MLTLGVIVAIVVVVRFVWSIISDMIDTPAWADPKKRKWDKGYFDSDV